MKNALLRALKDDRFTLILWIGVGMGYAALVVSIFPSFKGTDRIDQLLEAFPPFIRGLIGAHVQPISTLNGFLTMEFFSWLPLLGCFYAATTCSLTLSREMESKSIEILLSQPVSRPVVVVSKFLAFFCHGACVLGATLLTLFAAVGHAELAGQAHLAAYGWVAVQTLFTTLAMGSISLFVSALVREQRKAMAIATAICFSMFILHAISGMHPLLRRLAVLSVFHYFDASVILREGVPQWMNVLHLTSISVTFLLASAWTFEKRDMPS